MLSFYSALFFRFHGSSLVPAGAAWKGKGSFSHHTGRCLFEGRGVLWSPCQCLSGVQVSLGRRELSGWERPRGFLECTVSCIPQSSTTTFALCKSAIASMTNDHTVCSNNTTSSYFSGSEKTEMGLTGLKSRALFLLRPLYRVHFLAFPDSRSCLAPCLGQHWMLKSLSCCVSDWTLPLPLIRTLMTTPSSCRQTRITSLC